VALPLAYRETVSGESGRGFSRFGSSSRAARGGRALERRQRGSSRCTVVAVEVGGLLGNCSGPGVGKLPGFKQGLGADAFGAFPTRSTIVLGTGYLFI
jgi:hypothetical protein